MKFGLNFTMSVSKRVYTCVLKILCTFWLLNFYEVISNIYIYFYFERNKERKGGNIKKERVSNLFRYKDLFNCFMVNSLYSLINIMTALFNKKFEVLIAISIIVMPN